MIFLGLCSWMNWAQVNTYTFEKSGTLFPFLSASGASITTHTVEDDYVFPSIVNLPFTFRFGGVPQDRLGISENGFIWFGSAQPSDIYYIAPLSTEHQASVKGIVSALGIDLHPINTATARTEINTAVLGQAPNRTFVVEWRATARIETLDDPAGPDVLDFQIRLSEQNQAVEIVYGRAGILNKELNSNAEVGLKISATDFNIRTTQNGSWNNTQTGNSLSQTCLLSAVSKPAYGQKFIWKPSSLGLEQPEESAVVVYPNPAQEVVQIQGLNGDDWNYTLFDMSGRTLRENRLSSFSINLQGLAAGQYVLQISNGTQQIQKKLVKK